MGIFLCLRRERLLTAVDLEKCAQGFQFLAPCVAFSFLVSVALFALWPVYSVDLLDTFVQLPLDQTQRRQQVLEWKGKDLEMPCQEVCLALMRNSHSTHI